MERSSVTGSFVLWLKSDIPQDFLLGSIFFHYGLCLYDRWMSNYWLFFSSIPSCATKIMKIKHVCSIGHLQVYMYCGYKRSSPLIIIIILIYICSCWRMIVFIVCLSCHFLYRDFSCFRKNGLRRASHDSFGTRTISLSNFLHGFNFDNKMPRRLSAIYQTLFFGTKRKTYKKKTRLEKSLFESSFIYIIIIFIYEHA